MWLSTNLTDLSTLSFFFPGNHRLYCSPFFCMLNIDGISFFSDVGNLPSRLSGKNGDPLKDCGQEGKLIPSYCGKVRRIEAACCGCGKLIPKYCGKPGQKISHVEILENFSTANVDKLAQRHEMLFLLIYPHQVWISL
jgi:hypothetical protein